MILRVNFTEIHSFHLAATSIAFMTPLRSLMICTLLNFGVCSQITFEPELLRIETFFYTLKINLFEIIKLIPRLFNEFKLSKRNKEPSYSQQLFGDGDLTEIQGRINAGE